LATAARELNDDSHAALVFDSGIGGSLRTDKAENLIDLSLLANARRL
jgi:hypothetical protein